MDNHFILCPVRIYKTHYNQSEINYARIILTINGEPSLDQWLVWEDPLVNINHSSADDPVLQIDDSIVYPEEVISTMTDSNYISYTSNGDGHITIILIRPIIKLNNQKKKIVNLIKKL